MLGPADLPEYLARNSAGQDGSAAAPENPMSQTAGLKVRVDRARCQGHARCNALAPELFDLDDLGNAREVGDGSVPAGLEDKAWLARANCPELAIEVSEEQG